MRKQLISATIAIIASAATIGLAASPASAQVTPRIEVHGGWDHAGDDGVDGDGLVYGIGAGLDFQLSPRVVAGVEANLDFSSTDKCGTSVLAAGDVLCVEAGRDISAVGRLGYRVTDNGTIYALAGYTNGRFRIDYDPANGPLVTTRENLDGLRLGAGYQHDFANGLYSKVEYRYSNYEADLERHQVIAGLGIRF
jgi:outer membrane immunogenic protein